MLEQAQAAADEQGGRASLVFPASFAQHRLWFLDRLEPESTAYNLPFVMRLRGRLDVAALELALTGLVERHELLRTTFFERDGEVFQAVGPAAPVTVEPIAVAGADDSEAEAIRLATEEVGAPFDLARGPLLRARLLRLGDADHVLVLTLHHIAADGWSIGVLKRDLGELYAAALDGCAASLPELEVQYGDFAVWQREWLRGERLEAQLDYWRSQLANAPPVLELPADRPRPSAQSYRGAHRRRLLSPGLTARLRELGRQEQATLFMTLLSAFDVLLARYSGKDDILVATPIANRQRVELERLIGFFANTLVLRAELSDDPTFRELLRRTKRATVDALAHQELPFEQLVTELNPRRELSHAPLAQVMFVLQHADGVGLDLPGLEARPVELERGTAKFDLALFVVEWEDGLRASFEYATDLFDGETIERMLGHLETLLEGAVADPDRRVGELPLLAPAERARLDEWNATARAFADGERPVHELVEEQARRTPDAPALSFPAGTLTYAELDARAGALASRLRARGVGPDVPVGLFAERSPEALVAMLAVLKAGGAYGALDPTYPAARLAAMLEDLAPPVVLVQRGLAGRLPASPAEVVFLDDAVEEVAEAPDPPRPARPQDLAYVVFTSGSTGRAKGVAMPHAALSNLVRWQLESWTPPSAARTLQFASLSFDVSTQEAFTTWCSGGTLVLTDEQTRRDPEALLALLAEERIERLFMPFVALQQLAEAADRAGVVPTRLREVLTVGETLRITPAIRRFFARLEDGVLQNQYGATEFHTGTQETLAGPPGRWPARPPVGRPLANVRVHLLDRRGNEVPVGVPGEIHVAGRNVARGYVNRPDLTAERFLPDPFGAEEQDGRMYRTGDLARRLPDGRIEHLGRLDDQVKFRGYRVELGEIEAVLLQHPSVREAAAVVRETTAGEPRLVAYVSGANVEIAGLRDYLRTRLPEFMVPASVVELDALPLSANRKVDRLALPAPDAPLSRAVAEPPRDETERVLEEIWRETLGLKGTIGVREDFFELGGHSLLAVGLFRKIERRLGVRVPLAALFQGATIADLGAAVRRERGSGERWSPLVPLRESGERPPLFLVHPLNGELIQYRELVGQLDPQQPVYGLQAAGLDGREPPKATIEEMAAAYVEEIRKVQPHGPYLLAGYCFAGLVAYEMAHLLEQQGEETALVALIDTGLVGHGPRRSLLARERERFLVFRRSDLAGKAEWIARRSRQVKNKLYFKSGRRVYELCSKRGRPLPRRPWNPMLIVNGCAVGRYVPPRTGVRVTCFRAQTDDSVRAVGWNRVAGGGVNVRLLVAADIDHWRMMRDPHVRRLAAELTQAIDAAVQA